MNRSLQELLPSPGAVVHTGGRCTFTIYAPGKSSVALDGDFVHGEPVALQLIADGLWSTEKRLSVGTHRYRFVVDGQPIGDPYAREIEPTEDDQVAWSIVRVGATPYEWRHDDVPRARSVRDLILYELHVGDFSPAGTFDGVTERLDYIAGLGVNAIELMPVNPADGDHWRYTPRYLFAVTPAYGSPDDLRRLIDEAHARGIAVILDVVLAHTGQGHPFNRMYDYEESPWYGEGLSGLQNEFGLPTLDYAKDPTRAFASDVVRHWLRDFHVDGFRFDYAKLIGHRDGLGIPTLCNAARDVRDDAILIAEHLPENPEVTNDSGADAVWHTELGHALVAILLNREHSGQTPSPLAKPLETFDAVKRGYASPSQWVTYLESHDEERFLRLLENAGFEAEHARRRLALGLTMLFTAPGSPMLLHGQSWGEDAPKSQEPNPIDWDKLNSEAGAGLAEHVRRLCALRHDHPALRSDGYALDLADDEKRVVVWHRWNDEGDEVVVACNVGFGSQSVAVPFPSPGRWRDVIGEREVESNDDAGAADVELGENEAAVFVKV